MWENKILSPVEARVEPRDGHLPVGALHRLGPKSVAEGDEVHAAQRGGSIRVGVKRGGYAPTRGGRHQHPPAGRFLGVRRESHLGSRAEPRPRRGRRARRQPRRRHRASIGRPRRRALADANARRGRRRGRHLGGLEELVRDERDARLERRLRVERGVRRRRRRDVPAPERVSLAGVPVGNGRRRGLRLHRMRVWTCGNRDAAPHVCGRPKTLTKTRARFRFLS